MTSEDEVTTEESKTITDAADFETHVKELELLMERQLESAKKEEYDEFLALAPTMGVMLKAVTVAEAPVTHVAFDAIARIQTLHRELGLVLASRSDEMAKKMAQMKTGKTMHRAYKNAAGA